MAMEITVPRLGWSMDEGTFTQWLKAEGEFVRKGDMLFVLEGDKAAQEIESFDEGILRFLADGPKPGDTVLVGQLLGYLLVEGESPPNAPERSQSTSNAVTMAATTSAAQAATEQKRAATGVPTETLVADDGTVTDRVATDRVATPRARRRASEWGLDWRMAQGSGRDGRVRERDVVALRAAAPPSTGSSIRRTIADRMLASHLQTAPVTLTTTLDASALVALRSRMKMENRQPCPTYLDILVAQCAAVLQRHPRLNARWEQSRVVELSAVNIGIAVDTEDGLLVPVLHHVDRLDLQQVAVLSAELVTAARKRLLTVNQLRGGTFTITNLGSYGIDAFTPVINLPECAVLGMGRIARVPVVRGDRIEPGDQLSLSLTFDHRIVDGAPAARFLQELVRVLESL